MKANTLTGYKKSSKRLGRGRASGLGKTSGRGHKGQKARTGKKLRPGFEGGQTPIFQRLPKYRGFKNPNTVEYLVVNVGDLEKISGKSVTRETLLESGLIKKKTSPIKVLGSGVLSKALNVEVEKASESAIKKITDAGGKFTSTERTAAPKEESKKSKKSEKAPKEDSPEKKTEES